MLQKVSYIKCPKISNVSARYVLMWLDSTSSSFFKIQLSKTKSYCNINQEVVLMSETSCTTPWLMHWL
jgi:hypothetical protein